jgi:hypothetical protein
LPNEMEYSLSAQVGLKYREDFERRMRQIELAFSEEDANKRKFESARLHEEILERRSEILSAVAALYRNWAERGFPKGPTTFTSYLEWAEVVGGVMVAAGLGDLCLSFEGKYSGVGGDDKTRAMTELFRVGRQQFGGDWAEKKKIYGEIHEEQSNGNEVLNFFGPLADDEEARSNQTKLGIALNTFENRELGGIKLLIDESAAKSQQHKYRFVRVSGEDTPPEARGATVIVNREEAELQKLKAAYAGSREWLAARGGEDFGVKTE